jgi:hypothetical protein
MLADAGVPTAGPSYGGYTTDTCDGINFAYRIVIPEL